MPTSTGQPKRIFLLLRWFTLLLLFGSVANLQAQAQTRDPTRAAAHSQEQGQSTQLTEKLTLPADLRC